MRTLRLAILTAVGVMVLIVGCVEGGIFSHKPYKLPAGTVSTVNKTTVETEWSEDRWFVCGPGNTDICQGNYRTHVCPETLPTVGTVFSSVTLTWEPRRKCWIWSSKS